MASDHIRLKRRLLAPEVVQTSAMDCGPASLKCLLEGFGIPVSYGRLREACQTDVDGTSIDTIEEVAVQLGLEAEQVMVPGDHLLLPEASSLPAVVVTRLASGITHFVVVWRRHGPFVQVMDPGTGRQWPTQEDFLKQIYIHTLDVPAADWREWAASDNFLNPFRSRLARLGLSKRVITQLIDDALSVEGWRSAARLDAATRMTESILRSGGIRKGQQAAFVLSSCIEEAQSNPSTETEIIPENYWLARPATPDSSGAEQLRLKGAVLIHVSGRRVADSHVEASSAPSPKVLSPELIAALEEKPSQPWRDLFRMLGADGLLAPAVIIAALAAAAFGVIVEALLFQGMFDLSRKLGVAEQRLGAVTMLVAFAAALLLLEMPLAGNLLRLGRKLETRLRLAFLRKIPRLGDRYFQSRLVSDMAERSHSVELLRTLPTLGGRFIRLIFEIALTAAGIIWLDPRGATVAVTVAVIAVVLPLAMQVRLSERDLRIRNHNGALSRFYLDALLGLMPVRTHGAERAVRREHESLLVEWMHASFALLRAAMTVEAIEALVGFGLAAWLLLDHLARGGGAGGVLLLVYWALNLPVLGQEIALIAQQYPAQRNVTLRLLEPLAAPEDAEAISVAGSQTAEATGTSVVLTKPAVAAETATVEPVVARAGAGERIIVDEVALASMKDRSAASPTKSAAARIDFESVSVRAAGHLILDGVDLRIESGSHVAIVGPSGAGKSSFVGLLLGWHRAATGRVLVDGEPLTGERLERLRRETAWVDPAVQLWNRTLIENLRYGAPTDRPLPLGATIDLADLHRLLEKLPDGLQTSIGEGGGLLSGGEGQRVRLGRAMLKPGVRLVILDEPFRGLDRERRGDLLARARGLWREATLLCITHDVGETRDFERVLVIDEGRIVEDGPPMELAGRPRSRYRDLLEAEEMVREKLWASDEWRHLELDEGKLFELDRRDSV